MAIQPTAESFLERLERSRLIPPDRLKRLLHELNEGGLEADSAQAVADALVDREAITRWQADKLLQGRHKGFFLGKYRLLSLLGKGGMGSVYLAEHTLMRRRCAIKVLPAKRVHDTSYLGRFHREAQAVAALDHVNIVRAYDVDKEVSKDTEIHFLVMEYVHGRSLQDVVVRQGPLGYVKAADCIRQAADGLSHAHQAGLVHRDIKPGNLLVDENGVIKILDLGLARFFEGVEETESLTLAHDERVLGTADYLAPEQALDSHKVDARADIYSLGCTFYFLLTGHPPFTEGTLAQRLMAHQSKEPPRLEEKCRDIPAELLAIVRKMMAKKKGERYQTAAEVNAALKTWLVKNAGDEWRMRNSALIGSDSGISQDHDAAQQGKGGSSAVPASGSSVDGASGAGVPPSGSGPAAGETQTARSSTSAGEPPGQDDDRLAAFLDELDASESGRQAEAAASDEKQEVAASQDAPDPSRTWQDSDKRLTEPEAGKRNGEKADSGAPVAQPVAAPVAEGQHAEPPEGEEEKTVRVAVPVRQEQAVAIGAPAPDARQEPVSSAAVAPGRRRRSNFDFLQPVAGAVGSLLRKKGVRMAGIAAAGVLGLMLIVYAGVSFLGEFGENGTDGGTGTARDAGDAADDTPHEQAPQTERDLGDVTVGPGGDFKTIGEALRHVKQRYAPEGRKDTQTILVAGGQPYAERIVLDGSFPAGIRVVADSGARPVLAPRGEQPIVTLAGVARFELEGFDLKPVANQKAVVELSGYLQGTRLRDININGVHKTGILANGAVGFGASGQQIYLQQITLRGAGPEAVGMKLQQGNSDTSQVKVSGCRFLGEMAAGIVLQNSPLEIAVRESIFTGTGEGTGIKFDGSNMRLQGITIGNCTFYNLQRGILFTSLPATQSHGLMIARNLFAEVKGPEVVVASEYDARTFYTMFSHVSNEAMAFNWTSRPKPQEPAAGEVELFEYHGRRGAKIEFITTNADDPLYLAPVEKTRTPGLIADPDNDLEAYVGAVGG